MPASRKAESLSSWAKSHLIDLYCEFVAITVHIQMAETLKSTTVYSNIQFGQRHKLIIILSLLFFVCPVHIRAIRIIM